MERELVRATDSEVYETVVEPELIDIVTSKFETLYEGYGSNPDETFLDVEDYDPEEQSLRLRHHPETDTPLMNKRQGERIIAVSNEVCLVLDDWIREQRPDTTDDHGRNPLLSTSHGRVAKTTIRTYCYQITRPCAHGQECPHGRDKNDCEATELNHSAKCPSSVSPHPFRRGAITHYLQSDVPEMVVGDRANVTTDVIDQQYDQRSQKEKMEQRRGYLDNL